MNIEILVFEVAGCRFSVPLEAIEEVVPASAVTKIPNSPPFLLGLASVRGKVMGVIDAARRYSIGPGLSSHFMVCRVRGNLTAIAIDRPVVAGLVPVRPLKSTELEEYRVKCKVDSKFLKEGYELFEKEANDQPPKATGIYFLQVDADLFVSAEMASKVGEV